MSEPLVAPPSLYLVPSAASSCSLKLRNAADNGAGRPGKRQVPCAWDSGCPPNSCKGHAVGGRSTAPISTGRHDHILVAGRRPGWNQVGLEDLAIASLPM